MPHLRPDCEGHGEHKYIDDLAKGEWNWYFGSIGKWENLNMKMPSGPLLLLHDLGTTLCPEDQKRIEICFALV